MSDKGWIKLDRKIQEHWLWNKEKPFDFRSAWIDLIMMANHKPGKFPDGNEIKKIPAGSLVTSQKKLMERWGWGKNRLLRFLNLLESDHMIVKKSDHHQTTISIENYLLYQQSTNHKRTENGLQTDCKRTESGHKQEYKEDTTYLRKKESGCAASSPSAVFGYANMSEDELPPEAKAKLEEARRMW